jgi:hypothetical protein
MSGPTASKSLDVYCGVVATCTGNSLKGQLQHSKIRETSSSLIMRLVACEGMTAKEQSRAEHARNVITTGAA